LQKINYKIVVRSKENMISWLRSLKYDMKQLSIHQAKTGDHEMLHENKAGEVTAIEGASNISRGKTGEITLFRTYTSG
jgi:hypothetical protein